MAQDFLANYKAKHQHPLNRLSHSIGIPMIVISLPLFFFNWRWALVLFVAGWILQFVGHAIEGNQPAFFKNPVYLLLDHSGCCGGPRRLSVWQDQTCEVAPGPTATIHDRTE